LVVLTRNSPTTYYEDAYGNYAGLEYDLVNLFAQEIGVDVRFVVATEFSNIIPALTKKQVHLVARGTKHHPGAGKNRPLRPRLSNRSAANRLQQPHFEARQCWGSDREKNRGHRR